MNTLDFRGVLNRRIDPYWRKARIAARLWLKMSHGQWTARDRRLAARLAEDPGVTNRLIDQAISFQKAQKNGYRLLDKHD
jgi:hypothetical protein